MLITKKTSYTSASALLVLRFSCTANCCKGIKSGPSGTFLLARRLFWRAENGWRKPIRLLVGTFATQNRADGFQDDLDVQRERPVLYIVEVQADHILEREVAPAARLPVAGDAGDSCEALFVQLSHPLIVPQRQRT